MDTFVLFVAMKKNKIIKNVTIEKVWYWGIGIWLLENGKKVLVRGGVLPNSIVDVKVKRKKKDFIEAVVENLVHFDSHWADATPQCPHYNNPLKKPSKDEEHKIGCGGCKWQITSYEKQLALKHSLIVDSFRGAKDILDRIGIKPIIHAPSQYQYRNKIEFSFGKYIKGKTRDMEDGDDFINHQWNVGFHKQGEFSKVLDVDQCYLIPESMHKVYAYVKKLCFDSWLPVHDQKFHTGFFRHLVMRAGHNTGHLMVNLVVADQQLLTDEAKTQWKTLRASFLHDPFIKEHVRTFLITSNNGLADIVKWKDSTSEILFGDGTIYEKLVFNSQKSEQESVEVSFRISPFAFFQTNTGGAQVLFDTAAKLVGKVEWTIFDLYCGAGTIGLSFLQKGLGDFCAGVEIVESAIHDAYENAKINNTEKNSYFVAGKAEDLVFSDSTLKKKLDSLGLVIVDPPRSGLHKDVVKFLTGLRTTYNGKLLYISCNPVTLARDLALLEEWGWKTTLLQPVDMFPNTHHVETIALLH